MNNTKNAEGEEESAGAQRRRERKRERGEGEGRRDKFDRAGQIANKIGVRGDGPTRT